MSEIWDFLAEESEQAADEVIAALIELGENLGNMPSRFALVSGVRGGYRRAMFRTWAVYYRILETHVDIVRIVHGGRDVRRLGLR